MAFEGLNDKLDQAQGSNPFADLLADADLSESIVDPRVGIHEEAQLRGAEVKYNERMEGYDLILTWGNLTGSEGESFTYDQQVNIPTSRTPSKYKGMFRDFLKRFKVISQSETRSFQADVEEKALPFGIIFNRIADEGQKYVLELKEKDGYLRASVKTRK